MSYDYDANNNLMSAIDRSGVEAPEEKPIELSAKYDSLDRIELTSHRSSEPGTGGRANTFTYDEADWLKTQVIEGNKTNACDDDLKVVNVFKPTGLEDSRKIFRGTGSAPNCSLSSSPKQTTDWEYFANTKLHTLDISPGSAWIPSHSRLVNGPRPRVRPLARKMSPYVEPP